MDNLDYSVIYGYSLFKKGRETVAVGRPTFFDSISDARTIEKKKYNSHLSLAQHLEEAFNNGYSRSKSTLRIIHTEKEKRYIYSSPTGDKELHTCYLLPSTRGFSLKLFQEGELKPITQLQSRKNNFALIEALISFLVFLGNQGLTIKNDTSLQHLFFRNHVLYIPVWHIIKDTVPKESGTITQQHRFNRELIRLMANMYQSKSPFKSIKGLENKVKGFSDTVSFAIETASALGIITGYCKIYLDYQNISKSLHPFELDYDKWNALRGKVSRLTGLPVKGQIFTVLIHNYRHKAYSHQKIDGLKQLLENSGLRVKVIGHKEKRSIEQDDLALIAEIKADVHQEERLNTVVLMTGDGGHGESSGYYEEMKTLLSNYGYTLKEIVVVGVEGSSSSIYLGKEKFRFLGMFENFSDFLRGE